jgi:hypothetical protein
MKKSRFPVIVLSFLLAFVTAGLDAGSIKFRPTPTPSHQETVISNVSANVITVTTKTVTYKGRVENQTSRNFVVTKFTEINVNGQRATVSDLKPGMKVNVTIGTDPSQAARVNANG